MGPEMMRGFSPGNSGLHRSRLGDGVGVLPGTV